MKIKFETNLKYIQGMLWMHFNKVMEPSGEFCGNNEYWRPVANSYSLDNKESRIDACNYLLIFIENLATKSCIWTINGLFFNYYKTIKHTDRYWRENPCSNAQMHEGPSSQGVVRRMVDGKRPPVMLFEGSVNFEV